MSPMNVVPPDGFVIEAPDGDPALVSLAVAREQICNPLLLESLVDLHVGVGGIVLDVDGIGGREAVVDRRIAARGIVFNAVAARRRIVLRVGILLALLSVLGHVEAAHHGARLGQPRQHGDGSDSFSASDPDLVREHVEG
jgi:hypothetical protein